MEQKTENKFNPNDHISQIKGKDYLEVKWRLVWFRTENPNWAIVTEIADRGDQWALMKAYIKDETGRVLATGHKSETKGDFGDYLEKAETGAIGRALALLGYGTQFAPELEEGERIVDSPVTRKPSQIEASESTEGIKEQFRQKTQELIDLPKDDKPKSEWVPENTGVTCPQCKVGEVVKMTSSETGSSFYGCSAYKDSGCRYDKTMAEKVKQLVEGA